MIGRVTALIYGIASYLVFFLSFVYAMAFIGSYPVPKSIDTGSESRLAQSILIDVVLLVVFAIQYSVMARPAFKRRWTSIVPASCERSTYVLISSLLLILIFWQWRPIVATIWQVEGWPAALLVAIYWIGWLTALTSTYMSTISSCSDCVRYLMRYAEPRLVCRRSRRRCSTGSCVTR